MMKKIHYIKFNKSRKFKNTNVVLYHNKYEKKKKLIYNYFQQKYDRRERKSRIQNNKNR